MTNSKGSTIQRQQPVARVGVREVIAGHFSLTQTQTHIYFTVYLETIAVGSIMSSRLRWAGRLDMYRKVPMDLMEGTQRGSILSLTAFFVMVTLFLLETRAFFRKM